jgi:Holliday junction resolvase RusA-like endonuclease
MTFKSLTEMNEQLARDRGQTERKPLNDEFAAAGVEAPVVRVKKRKVVARSDNEFAQAALRESEKPAPTLELTPPDSAPIDPKTLQRPNAVIKNGGPQLLRGLMLPFPPSANRYWQQLIMVKKGSKFPIYIPNPRAIYQCLRSMQTPTDDARAYIERIKESAMQRGFQFFTEKDLRMELLVCPRDRREIDPHNYEKVVLDALQHAGVYHDDKQVKDLRTRLGPVMEEGRLIISLWEVKYDPNAVLREAWG